MTTAKTATLTFYIVSSLTDALRTDADQEHPSISNMVEVMIRDYCGRAKLPIRIYLSLVENMKQKIE